MPTPLIDTLRRLSRSDLADLLAMLSDRPAPAETEDAATVCSRLLETLRATLGLGGATDDVLERHLVRRVATALGVDYDPAMDSGHITREIKTFITDTIVYDLRPFIQVAVCMGWADGALCPEEIAVVDAALSRLKLLVPRRAELLGLCASPIRPDDLAASLASLSGDDQKAWSLLALAWAVALADLTAHPAEVSALHALAGHLGVTVEQADRLRELVTRRFEDGLAASAVGPGHRGASRALAKATMAAMHAADLDEYLHAATGLRTLSALLSSPVPVRPAAGSVGVLDAVLERDGWVGVPTVMAGTLFLRRLGSDPELHKLLVVVLVCLERMR